MLIRSISYIPSDTAPLTYIIGIFVFTDANQFHHIRVITRFHDFCFLDELLLLIYNIVVWFTRLNSNSHLLWNQITPEHFSKMTFTQRFIQPYVAVRPRIFITRFKSYSDWVH